MDKEIRIDDLCLDVAKSGAAVQMVKCHHMKGNQLWEFNEKVKKTKLLLVKSNPPQKDIKSLDQRGGLVGESLRQFYIILRRVRLYNMGSCDYSINVIHVILSEGACTFYLFVRPCYSKQIKSL